MNNKERAFVLGFFVATKTSMLQQNTNKSATVCNKQQQTATKCNKTVAK
ncbi:hypothetical protein [Tenacibaculum aiptasiae]|nr:hypothetical protein [Tenacibaculum aiptasiae]